MYAFFFYTSFLDSQSRSPRALLCPLPYSKVELTFYLSMHSICKQTQSIINFQGHHYFVVWSLCHVRLFVTPWTVAHQAPLFIEFSRQEYWSGLPFPSPGDLPDPGIEPRFLALQVYSLPSEPPGKPPLFYIPPNVIFKLWHNAFLILYSFHFIFIEQAIKIYLEIRFYNISLLHIWKGIQVSCFTGGFFTSWATREAQQYWSE